MGHEGNRWHRDECLTWGKTRYANSHCHCEPGLSVKAKISIACDLRGYMNWDKVRTFSSSLCHDRRARPRTRSAAVSISGLRSRGDVFSWPGPHGQQLAPQGQCQHDHCKYNSVGRHEHSNVEKCSFSFLCSWCSQIQF